MCHSCGQGCAPDRLATTSEGHSATVPICTETPSTLTHPAANTCTGLLAALHCGTSGPLLEESPASMVHAAPLLTNQPFVVAFGAPLSGVTYYRHCTDITCWPELALLPFLISTARRVCETFTLQHCNPAAYIISISCKMASLRGEIQICSKHHSNPANFCLASWSGTLIQVWIGTYFEADLLWARGLSRWLPEGNRGEGPTLTSLSAPK